MRRSALIRGLLAAVLCMLGWRVQAQNQLIAYAELGSATPVNDMRYGVALGAEHRLCPKVMLLAGVRLDNRYPSGLGDVQAGVRLFPSCCSDSWSIAGIVNFSNYAPYPMNQLYGRITGAWECRHFRVDFGNTFAMYMGSGVVKWHLLRPSFCLRGTLRGGERKWDAALYIRNFNRFDAYGSKCVDWGAEVWVHVGDHWRIFCESFVTTAGILMVRLRFITSTAM